MTLTVNVSAELEHKIEDAARQNGVSSGEFVRTVLEEKFDSQPGEQRRKLPFAAKIIAANLPVRDRSKEHEWLKANGDQYAGKFVALEAGNLVAVGENAKEAAVKARELGVQSAYVAFVEGSEPQPFISGGAW